MHLIELHHSALHYKELTVSMVGRQVYCSVGLTWAAGVGWMERSLQLFATVQPCNRWAAQNIALQYCIVHCIVRSFLPLSVRN